jgi:DNA-binding CsgD family transcriptional regulator
MAGSRARRRRIERSAARERGDEPLSAAREVLRSSAIGGVPPSGFRAYRIEMDGEVFVFGSYPIETEHVAAALTVAEGAVVEAAAAGLSNAEIARQRGTSARTVANLLARAFAKLHVRTRLELAARWQRD